MRKKRILETRKRFHTLQGCYNVLTDEWMKLSKPKLFKFPKESEVSFQVFQSLTYVLDKQKGW